MGHMGYYGKLSFYCWTNLQWEELSNGYYIMDPAACDGLEIKYEIYAFVSFLR